VLVKTSHGQSDPFNLMIDLAAPTLFALDGNSAAALHTTSYQVISSNNPAVPGEYIALYGTGFGAGYGPQEILSTRENLFVLIDGRPATTAFAGRAPGYQGLDQINVQVPEGIHHGTSVPVTVTVANGPPPSCAPNTNCATFPNDPSNIIPRVSNTVSLPIK
jgi:uncharacterized protein (TIGR03437 family)